MSARISQKEYEKVSAYLDRQLSLPEREKFEQQLLTSSDLKQCLDELRQTRQIIQSTPRKSLPHSFILTEAMLRPKPVSFLFPVFSLTSVFSFLLIFLSFFVRLLPSTSMIQVDSQQEKALQSPPGASYQAALPTSAINLGGSPTSTVDGNGVGQPPAPAQPSIEEQEPGLMTKELPSMAPAAPLDRVGKEAASEMSGQEIFTPQEDMVQPTATAESILPEVISPEPQTQIPQDPTGNIPLAEEREEIENAPTAPLETNFTRNPDGWDAARALLLFIAFFSGAAAVFTYRKSRG